MVPCNNCKRASQDQKEIQRHGRLMKSCHIPLSAFAFCKPVHGIQGLLMPLPKLDKSQGSSLGQNVLCFIHPSLFEQNSSYTCNHTA